MSHGVPCGMIREVAQHSLAARAGLRAGDCLIAINDEPVRDIIDVQFLAAEEHVEFRFFREGSTLRRRAKRYSGDIVGLEFESPLFDGIRECENHCPFCFVRQMPAGLRSSLYIQDDDYRLSFLHGSFVTLTNLREDDWNRIARQRLSPLYVSVHATDPVVRERLLGRRQLPPIMEQLRRLIEMGITVHTQIVIVPDVNDGDVLSHSIEELSTLYPGLASIGLVPLGLTKFCPVSLRRNTPHEAENILESATQWHAQFRHRFGQGLVYAADEWFLQTGHAIPSAEYYDDFQQLENGIGLTRLLLDDWHATKDTIPLQGRQIEPVLCVCGTLIAPILSSLLEEFKARAGVPISLAPVTNHFFGDTVTVSGLLVAEDVISAIRTANVGYARLCLPRTMFDHTGDRTLDGFSLSDIAANTGTRPFLAGLMSELLAEISHSGAS